jgi:hypothetical protein
LQLGPSHQHGDPSQSTARLRAGSKRPRGSSAPPKSVMNSRRLIASPEVQDKASYRLKLALWKGPRK